MRLILPSSFKGFLLFAICFLLSIGTFAQDFTGFNVNPWAGVTSIDLQPANIVGTVYRADINLVGMSLYAGNNYLAFNPKTVYRWSLNQDKSNELEADGIKTKAYINTRIHLPSFMYEINPNMAVAFTMQARASVQVQNAGKELVKLAYEDLDYAPYLGKTYDTPGITINQLSWTEIGLTYGYLHYLNGGHRFKIAGRLKYLMGLNALYLNSADGSFRADAGDILSVYNTNVSYGHSEIGDPYLKFKPQAHSVGFDVGFKYSFKNRIVFGVSLLDVGTVSFDKAPGSGNFNANINNWDLNPVQFNSLQDFNDTIASRVTFTADTRKFKMSLPTALSFQGTVYLWDSGVFEGGGYNNVYLSFNSYTAIGMGGEGVNRLKAVNSYVFTPGFTTIAITGGLPVTINEFQAVNVGGFLRLGPFVVGSKNFFTSLFKKELYEADIYWAIKIPLLKDKPTIVQGCPKRF